MKGQILSRIQSYQSIRPKSISNQHHNHPSSKHRVLNQEAISKYLNLSKNNKNNDTGVASPRKVLTKVKSKYGGSSLDPLRRSNNKTKIQEVKRPINYQRGEQNPADELTRKYFVIPKKMSNKQFNLQEIRSLYRREQQNQPNRQNTISHDHEDSVATQRSLAYNKNIQSSKDLNEMRITSKRQFMKVFNRKNLYREHLPTACTTSQKKIELDKNVGDKYYETLGIDRLKKVKSMAKTTTVFLKDKKTIPYLQLSHKKIKEVCEMHSQDQPALSGTGLPTEEKDVSIQISQSSQIEEDKLQSIKQQQELQFECSRIEETQMENDSSFLEASQKQLLKTMGQNENTKRRKPCKHWRKLPSDFLGS